MGENHPDKRQRRESVKPRLATHPTPPAPRLFSYPRTRPKLAGRPLWMDERGTSGDLAEIVIRCDCKVERPFFEATRMGENPPLGNCNGSRPWLGPYTKESCGAPNRLLVRSASNAYFPQKINVISLPDRDEAVSEAVDRVGSIISSTSEDIEDLKKDRKRKPPVAAALEGLTDEEVYEEIERRRGDGFTLGEQKSVKQVELETLIASREEIGSDKPDGTFFARTLPTAQWKDRDEMALDGGRRASCPRSSIARGHRPGWFHSIRVVVTGRPRVNSKWGSSWLPLRESLPGCPRSRTEERAFFSRSRVMQSTSGWHVRRSRTEAAGLSAGFECWKADHKQSKRVFPGLPYRLLALTLAFADLSRFT